MIHRCIFKTDEGEKTKKMIGKFIKSKREEKKITLKKLGKSMGIDLSYVAKIESGSRNIQVGHVKKISKALGVPESDIFALQIADTIIKKYGKNPMFKESFSKATLIIKKNK